MRLSWSDIRERSVSWIKKQLGQQAWSSVLHVVALLALMTLLRPWFFRGVGEAHYQASSIFTSMVKADLLAIANAARRHQPFVPEILGFFVPAVLFLLAKRRLRWTDWEHGKNLRVFVMAVLIMLAWSGATFPYNMYLGRLHGSDRLLLVAFTALSWRYPIFVPLAARWAIVMLKECYVPIPQDDFDFRAPMELIVVFAIFAWASASRSFQPAHFLVAGLGAYASYYWAAGVAKWEFGPPNSWLVENHVSNLAVSTYVRGWNSWLPEGAFLQFAAFARKTDLLLAGYTLLVELGALCLLFLHRRVTRWVLLSWFVLNFGIFLMSGVCFWKWMFVTLFGFFWMGRSGKPLIARLHEYKLPLLLGIASIYWSMDRIWYFPQTHVVWYDTRLQENYELYVIGESGQRYLVQTSIFAPMDMHFTQGRLCYATDKERSTTGIYGTSGNINTLRQLETFERPEQGLALTKRGRLCKDPKKQQVFDKFMTRFFGNMNKTGPRATWLHWIRRPHHLHISPKGDIRPESGGYYPEYEAQEKVVTLEMWLTATYHHGGALHRTEPRLVRTLALPH